MKELHFELGILYGAIRSNHKAETYIDRIDEQLNDFICFTIEEKHFQKWNSDTIKDLSLIVRQVWNLVNYRNRTWQPLYELIEKADSEIFHYINN